MILQEVIQKINEADGKIVYVAGSFGLKEVEEIIDSGYFTDVVNDGIYEKRITLQGLRDYLKKYGDLLYCDSAVISYDEESEKFKLYITKIFSEGKHVQKKHIDTISDGEWFERFKMDTVLTFPGALEVHMVSYESWNCEFKLRLEFELLNEYIDEQAVFDADEDSFIDKVYDLFDE